MSYMSANVGNEFGRMIVGSSIASVPQVPPEREAPGARPKRSTICCGVRGFTHGLQSWLATQAKETIANASPSRLRRSDSPLPRTHQQTISQMQNCMYKYLKIRNAYIAIIFKNIKGYYLTTFILLICARPF